MTATKQPQAESLIEALKRIRDSGRRQGRRYAVEQV